MLVTLDVSQLVTLEEKFDTPLNIHSMPVTLDVSHLDTSEANLNVESNKPLMLVTLDVSQPERSSSKSDKPENKLDMSVTPDVFQLEIGPQESSVFDEFKFHSRTNLNKVSLSMVSQLARLLERKLQVTHTASRKEVFLCRNRNIVAVVVCCLLLWFVVCGCSSTISSSAPIGTMTQKCSYGRLFKSTYNLYEPQLLQP